MRLERLDVTGFGPLQSELVIFHPRLTVVAGANESGKSSLHRAVRAALYGLDAGGQGRPVERSDWARWAPWSGGAFGLALAYSLDDGRRIRVARRFDTREQPVQVLELGGADLTDDLRHGRGVCPGRYHLGVDEAVFCATAWLGDEALRLGSPDGAAARSDHLQEAIERLADTRDGATAVQAIARLQEALQRVGSERRASSPLGALTLRLRELDRALDESRRRHDALAVQRERLRDLERGAAAADSARREAEQAWLAGRIAVQQTRRRLLMEAVAETAQLESIRDEAAPLATFPLDAEERAATLAGSLAEAEATAREARTRAQAAAEPLAALRRRRTEIAGGLEAIAGPPMAPEQAAQAQRLQGELQAARGALERLEISAVDDARVAGLRREIARTGLGTLEPETVPALAGALQDAGRGRRVQSWAALAVLAPLGGLIALAASRHAQPPWIGLAGLLLGIAAGAVAAWRLVLAQAERRSALRRLTALELAAGLDAGGLLPARDRVAAFAALHAALLREEARTAGRLDAAAALHSTAVGLAARCRGLAAGAGLAVAPVPEGAATAACLEAAATALALLEERSAAQRRREQLLEEDRYLAAQEAEHERLDAEASQREAQVTRLREALSQLQTDLGLPADARPEAALAPIREACAARRRYDEALRGLATVKQRVALIGDAARLRESLDSLCEELMSRGGDVVAALAAPPPDEAGLRRLEDEARRARQQCASTTAQARELRARLGGLLEGAPDLADLENERESCAALLEQAQRRRAALTRAVDLIERASQTTHRDVAPQLASHVAARLARLTAGRYLDVNVDTDRFAVSVLTAGRPDMVPLEQTSHGTRDQVALLLRLALCDVLGSGETFPLLLDEPVLSADPSRRDALIEFLLELTATNQVVLTTSDPAVVDAVRRAAGDDCDVVRLGAAPAAAEIDGRHAALVRAV